MIENSTTLQARPASEPTNAATRTGEEGFTLVETTCALVIILIALLGVAFSFTYAINYNAGNQSRSQALAVLQAEVEKMRAAKFTPTVTDAALAGGTKLPRTVSTATGASFLITMTVDNDPFTADIQDDVAVTAPTMKEIIITTKLSSPSPGWQLAVPSTIVLRRVRSN